MGNDYFCDTGAEYTVKYLLYTSDPLWDGQDCGSKNTCCEFNDPPFFWKDLPDTTTDDIEVRLCADEGPSNEDSPVELIELYIE